MYLIQVWIPKLESAYYVKMTDFNNIDQINNDIAKRSMRGSFGVMNKNTLDTSKKKLGVKRSVGALKHYTAERS